MTWIVLALAIWASDSAFAAAERTDFLVNDDGGLTSQSGPRIAIAGTQGFAIVWVDRRLGNNDIYLQRYDSAGSALGNNTRVNDDAAGSYQAEPAIAGDLFGQYASVWRDYRNGTYPIQPDIFMQRFDSLLVPIGANTDATSACPDSLKESPDVAIGRTGAGLVVWADYRNRNWDIYGQLFSSDGSLVDASFRINDDVASSQQHAPRVAVSSDGWYVVAWYDNRTGNDDIYIQRLDSLGNPLGVNVRVNSDLLGKRQAFPDVAVDSAGNFTVAWIDWRNGIYPLNPDIYVRRFDSLMRPAAGEFRVNADAPQTTLRKPAMAADRVGNILVAWSDSTSTSWDVRGQLLDPQGNLSGSNFCLTTDTDGSQLDPDVVIDGEMRYVTWADNRNGNWDIFAAIARYHDPTLVVDPGNLYFVTQHGGELPAPAEVEVFHAGIGEVDYSVSTSADWLNVSPPSGTTLDTVVVSVVDNTLSAGSHFATVTFTDIDGRDSSASLSVRLDVLELPSDTIAVGGANVEVNQVGSVPVLAKINNEAADIVLCLTYPTEDMTVDSVIIGPSPPGEVALSAVIDQANGLVSLHWQSGTTVVPADYYLADLFFTAGDHEANCIIDTVSNDTLYSRIEAYTLELTPAYQSGEISVSIATGLTEETPPAVPSRIRLAQNSPNPFNLSTVIIYDLPHTANVTLEVFNVLGQRVMVLEDGVKPAGTHHVRWNGLASDGEVVPSGIYFYRLRTQDASLVRKAVLLK